MTPEQLIQNVTTLAQALLPSGGILGAIVGTLVYGYGKIADAPMISSWGKRAWIGAGVLFGGTAVIGLIQNIAGRIFGG